MSHENPTTSVRYYILPDWPAYRIGDDSSFWTRHKLGKKGKEDQHSEEWRLLHPSLSDHGYLRVNLRRGERKSCGYIHVLLLEAFVYPRPLGLEGCHKDDNKLNNSLGNLYWGTRKQNVADMIRNGHQANGATYGREYPTGEKHPGVKLSDNDIRNVRIAYAQGCPRSQIMEDFGISQSYISLLVTGKSRPECGGPMPSEELRGVSKIESGRLARVRRKARRILGVNV